MIYKLEGCNTEILNLFHYIVKSIVKNTNIFCLRITLNINLSINLKYLLNDKFCSMILFYPNKLPSRF